MSAEHTTFIGRRNMILSESRTSFHHQAGFIIVYAVFVFVFVFLCDEKDFGEAPVSYTACDQ